MSKYDKHWYEAMLAKGHDPIMMDYGDGDETLDIFVTDVNYCNGPGCKTCGWSCCMHCGTVDQIPQCTSKIIDLDMKSKRL